MAHVLEQTEATKAAVNGEITVGVSVPRLEDFYISEKTGFLIEQPLVRY